MEKMIEISTPLIPNLDAFLERIISLGDFDSLILREQGGIDKFVVAAKCKDRLNKKMYFKISCSDKNRIGIHSELVTASSLGFSHLVLTDGTHPLRTSFPSAKPVFDLDALSLLCMLKQDAPRFSNDLPPLRLMAQWKVGFCIGGITKPDVARARKSIALGADFVLVRSLEAVTVFRHLTTLPIVASIPQKEAPAIPEAISKAQAAGADAINLVLDEPGE